MKQKAYTYQDPWKQFKVKLLKQVDYFRKNSESQEDFFFEELQQHMVEETYEAGTEIISLNEPLDSMFFIVQGELDLFQSLSSKRKSSSKNLDQNSNTEAEKECFVETLGPGDVIGQYSFIFEKEFRFRAVAKKDLVILSIS